MSDLKQAIRDATATVKAEWTAEHAEKMEGVFVKRHHRRKVVRRAAISLTALACLIGVGLAAVPRLRNAKPSNPATLVAADGVVRLEDGSTATPLEPGSVVRVSSSLPTRSVIEVQKGGARFSVTRNPARVFRVEAGDVAVEVLGTQFAVERIGRWVRVSVYEGRVRVLWDHGETELGAFASDLFPPEPAVAPVAVEKQDSPPRKKATSSRTLPREPSWKDLAQDGEYQEAYEAMARKESPSVGDEPADLLLAADVKRLSHHPAEALVPLRKIVTDHRDDPRAQLAAFTLGRVLLDELGRPKEAAQAFADAEALAPDGALAEDAVAREVEAWSRAGDATRACAVAEDYLKRYPEGRKRRSVRKFGGIE